jgi:Ni,Fe-hydrogenase III small subunit
MNNNVEFQVVCGDCGSLAIKIENPVTASRKTVVCCGECGVSRGTVGALRDLAVRPDAHVLPTRLRVPRVKPRSELVARHQELQNLRRKVQLAGSNQRTEQ